MGRAPCCAKEGVNRGAWTATEDRLLVNYITQHGEGKWKSMPKLAGLKRCGKSCRLRWLNYLRPDIKRGNIEPDEEDLILKLHRLLGNRWRLIAGRLPGRTDNEIKNYWNTTISKKKQASAGADVAAATVSTSAGNSQHTNPPTDHHDGSSQTNNNNNKKMRKKTVVGLGPPQPIAPPTSGSPISKAVRPKATRCTKVIIPIPDLVVNGTSTAVGSGGDYNHHLHHENYSVTSSGEMEIHGATNSGGDDEEGQLLLQDYLNYDSFPEVVGRGDLITAPGEPTAADSGLWSMLNDWINSDEPTDDNTVIF